MAEKPTQTRRARDRQRAQGTVATEARVMAYEVGKQVRVREGFARELLDSMLAQRPLPGSEAAFCRVLVFGVVATQGCLDQLIDRVLAKPSDIDDEVRDCLRISTYELFYLGKAAHASVDQGVALVRHVRKKAAGVANFVLRRLVELRPAFPFGDPASDLQARALRYGFPLWMTELLDEVYGAEKAIAFMNVSNRPAPVFFTVNRCLCDQARVLQDLSAASIACEQTATPGVFRLTDSAAVSSAAFMQLIHAGSVIISDLSPQTIVQHIMPATKPASMLEVGAGRGTKTLLLQSAAVAIYGEQLNLTSIDLYDFKADLLAARLQRYGVTQGTQEVGDATDLDATFGDALFDVVFIDAPCSGVGTLRRHPEIRWRLQPEGVDDLARTGAAMLRSAATHVPVGGTILYSTCTITPAETTSLVADFLASSEGAGFSAIDFGDGHVFAPALTADGRDAHFAVKLRRNA